MSSPIRDRPAAVNETPILRELVRQLELGHHPVMSVDEISRSYGVKRRTLYDFIGIFSVFGICRRSLNNSMEWLGLSHIVRSLDDIRHQVQADSGRSTLVSLFNYAANPSLSHISEAVVRLFFCLRLRYLDLRKVARLFAHGQAKYKTMLRKLYTVVCGLELAGIVSRTDIVSQIKLNVPLDDATGAPIGLAAILNTQEEIDCAIGIERRRKEFDQIAVGCECTPVKLSLDAARLSQLLGF
jgi:hypothetical protein